MKNKLKWGGVGAASVAALAVSFTGPFEGLRLKAYKDPVGIVTACYGETKGIKLGMTFTKEQCDEKFLVSLKEHETGMLKCMKVPVPPKVQLALLDFTYNVGVGAFCKSTLAKRVNAGEQEPVCGEFKKWIYAGKGSKRRVLKGLVTRREAEEKVCREGFQPEEKKYWLF